MMMFRPPPCSKLPHASFRFMRKRLPPNPGSPRRRAESERADDALHDLASSQIHRGDALADGGDAARFRDARIGGAPRQGKSRYRQQARGKTEKTKCAALGIFARASCGP